MVQTLFLLPPAVAQPIQPFVHFLHFLLMNYGLKIGTAISLRCPFIIAALFLRLDSVAGRFLHVWLCRYRAHDCLEYTEGLSLFNLHQRLQLAREKFLSIAVKPCRLLRASLAFGAEFMTFQRQADYVCLKNFEQSLKKPHNSFFTAQFKLFLLSLADS